MPTVSLTTSNQQYTGQNLTANGSGTSWTIASQSGSSDAVTISESSASVTISATSRTPGQSVTISPTSTNGNYTVTFSQTVASGKGGSGSTTYTAQVSGTVSGAPATPTYSLGSISSLDEGSYVDVSVTTTNFGSGTLYYTLSPSADFTTSSGSVSISNSCRLFLWASANVFICL